MKQSLKPRRPVAVVKLATVDLLARLEVLELRVKALEDMVRASEGAL